ncbi:MAG: hypothetical protein ACO1NS_07060 [Daejeonella sp.]
MMNSKEILRKAGGILNELNEQYEYLSRNPDNLSELELELFSANATFLSDHLSILVKLNEKASNTNAKQSLPDPLERVAQAQALEETEPGATEESAHAEESISPDWKFELEKEPGLTFDFEEKETDKLIDPPLTEEEEKVIDEKTKKEDNEIADTFNEPAKKEDAESESNDEISIRKEEAEEIHVKEVVISERTIAVPSDQVLDENPKLTVNDLLSRTLQQKSVSSQFSSRQTKDLKGMVSLNDKLLFVRDLFNGYSLAYSEAIELLNRFDNFESADNFLKQNYAAKNNWSAKQDVADKFYEILSRRFAK